ncbi:ribbon-helix-helix protein, CopG family [Methylobacterium sp. EM32]|uniref:ribbon-helix-helix protein, CopG family n=1 Tax=Methylobacterium sp. EM32 TaxID=3163481 RepID=UPI0033A36E5D
MLTTVEIPPEQVEALDRIAAREHTSRDALVQSLIAEFVAKHGVKPDIDRFFGAWADRTIDGLDHQERLRSEW